MKELTLKGFFKIIKKRLWVLLTIPIVAVLVALALLRYTVTPKYTAQMSMYVLNRQDTESTVNFSDLQSSALLTADYRELALSRRVLDPVAEELGLSPHTRKYTYRIAVESANTPRAIEISATAADPL